MYDLDELSGVELIQKEPILKFYCVDFMENFSFNYMVPLILKSKQNINLL